MYHLLVGDAAYSSWSLRGWLLFEKIDIARKTRFTQMYSEGFKRDLEAFFPARTVPAVKCEDGLVLSDSLAIAEELASRHPEAGLWPSNPKHRAVARQLTAEMHSSFVALRDHCPMNLRIAYKDCVPTDGVLADLARIETLWDWARQETGSTTEWLCGAYSVADAFYAPIAARIAGYGLLRYLKNASYVQAHLADHAFRRLRAVGMVLGVHQSVYDKPYEQVAFPVPKPLAASAVGDE